mmetsp:Transcript_35453/g.89297  ORF Transcript_35453/g.89297 Transcript_35453/m.89297 type:complete len:383 (-) Transcript_35453:115-1263(-)|eukprot:CAMPEP_0115190524 /NCGR_PEP_ID=MMETSP0270-20121206/12069_1 /TAXON_ID=71861 /ORGANISM="Scrippsiella trochoidea, Strain CCMP3099" /LENGTH=382 /DNA_ID=CAMNT_0002603737 /DNA_START=52 /DNA_END=1200 /DNA_ORIENTATION=+
MPADCKQDHAGTRRAARLCGHVLGAFAQQPVLAPQVVASSVAGDEVDIDVDHVAYGFMASQALFGGLEIGLFDHIASHGGPAPIEVLNRLTGVEAPRLQTLVTALTAIKALRRTPEGSYVLSPNTAKFLVRSSKYFYGDYLRMQIGQQFYRHMGALPEVIKTGKAPDYAQLFSDPAEADLYTRAQHNGSLATAKQLCRLVDFKPMKSMLDIGGGSGAFSIVICRQHPQINATVLELPEVCKTGQGFVKAEPDEVAKRIKYTPGSCLDAWPSELGTNHDIVLISYVSESVPADAVLGMYTNAFARLRPGGVLIVHSFMVNDTLDGPELGALWSLQHVAVNADGVGLCPSIVEGLMRKAGFGEISHRDMIGGMTKMVIGKKPAQ